MSRRVVHKPAVERTERPRLRIERYLGLELPGCALVAIGRSEQSAARPGIAPHRHATFEFSTIRRGQLAHLIDGRPVVVDPGQILLTRPNQVHGCPSGVVQPCTILWLQVDPRRLADTSLRKDLEQIRASVLREDPRLEQLQELMLQECGRALPDSPRMINALLAQYIALVIRSARADSASPALPAPLQRIVDTIRQDPSRRWTLPAMEQCAGIRHSRLSLLFQKHLGQSPAAYALQVRLAAARDALAQNGSSVTRVAMRFGFSSAQHLATAFRMHYGIAPRSCR